jgi:hypothetical protein
MSDTQAKVPAIIGVGILCFALGFGAGAAVWAFYADKLFGKSGDEQASAPRPPQQGGPGGRGAFGAFGGRGGRGGPGAFSIPMMVADNEQLQKELKIDADQLGKIKAAVEKVNTDLKDDVAKMRERDASREERDAARKKVTEATEKALAGVLKSEQNKRIEQIQNQMAGVRMYSQPKIQEALKLTDEQKEKIKTALADLEKKTQGARDAAGGDFAAMREQMQAINKEATEAITKVLDDSQKKTLDELTGPKFEMQFQGGRRGGGPGGGPGGST